MHWHSMQKNDLTYKSYKFFLKGVKKKRRDISNSNSLKYDYNKKFS
jgi:hypothetical protein